MIIGLQIVSLFFSLFMIYIALLHFKKGEISKFEMYIWFLIWAFTMYVVLFPDRLQNFARIYFARTFDMMVAGAFILVIFMVTKTYLSTKQMEKKLEDLVRKEALKDVKKSSKK